MTDPISGKPIGANADMEEIGTAADSLNGWSGAAAHAFKTKFLDPFPAIASNRLLLLGIMKGAVEADQELWMSAREDIANIAKKHFMRWTT
ncbi:hypothetical protein FHX42_003696 [Saccharopolyspora lacisalsi]|uniref:Uncharacterized protein n=1 Tax=Halosaccharopolyspora lacisalsi TaxID=1000566 RepID=A0A839DZP6_9PSEU|nr:hypothetical protein [Halosaccharopolyspora lacisalsi]MBA8826320.1 hypothetical protein [Halosaccharopolyspora lacisalsi]